jgi:hypothetical protein
MSALFLVELYRRMRSWVTGLIASILTAFPDAYFQGCDWHAAEAMPKRYPAKKNDCTSEETNGRGE